MNDDGINPNRARDLEAEVRELRAALAITKRALDVALAEVVEWIAEGFGYPVDTTMLDRPMPEAAWQALVDHVHRDESGRWHGRTLDREDTESWLADEAGRA